MRVGGGTGDEEASPNQVSTLDGVTVSRPSSIKQAVFNQVQCCGLDEEGFSMGDAAFLTDSLVPSSSL